MLGAQSALLVALAAAVDGNAVARAGRRRRLAHPAGLGELQRAIVGPLRQAEDAVYALAGGDLSHLPPPGRDDEVGRLLLALRQLNVNLTAIVGDVRANVGAIEAATRDIAAGNQRPGAPHRIAGRQPGADRRQPGPGRGCRRQQHRQRGARRRPGGRGLERGRPRRRRRCSRWARR
jgi:HAMP domain-containing protein